jgi:hypothetical protein
LDEIQVLSSSSVHHPKSISEVQGGARDFGVGVEEEEEEKEK